MMTDLELPTWIILFVILGGLTVVGIVSELIINRIFKEKS